MLAAFVTGCQATEASIAPGRPSSVETSIPTAAPAPTTGTGPIVSASIDGTAPVIASSDGIPGHPFANPAAAARANDGSYVLFLDWFNAAGDSHVVTVARSTDGLSWHLSTKPIYTDLGMDLATSGPGPVPAAAVQLADDSWVLYGWAAHADSPQAFSSWRATAPAPEGPWTLTDPVALGPGAAEGWDGQIARIGAVRQSPGGVEAWYEGEGPGSGIRGDIGYATSTDGRMWMKHDDPSTTGAAFADSDPVIRHGICGKATAIAVYQPELQSIDGMLVGTIGAYGIDGQFAFFGVTSADGIHWRCGSTDPVIRQSDLQGSQGLHSIASLPLDGKRVELLLESLGEGKSDIWSATVTVAH
jgi:hypothetical protein